MASVRRADPERVTRRRSPVVRVGRDLRQVVLDVIVPTGEGCSRDPASAAGRGGSESALRERALHFADLGLLSVDDLLG